MAKPGRTEETVAEMVAAWDRGEPVWTVEMGGIGPGYEQAIQVLVLELLRDSEPLPQANQAGRYDLSRWGEAAVSRCDKLVGGFSGAQVGAAKSLALTFLLRGVTATLDAAPQDRKVLVSRRWPQAPEVARG